MVNNHWVTSQTMEKPSVSTTVGLVLHIRFHNYHLIKNTVQDGHSNHVSAIHQNTQVSAYIFVHIASVSQSQENSAFVVVSSFMFYCCTNTEFAVNSYF